MLGVNSEQKESMQHYISDSIYGLTLAWITSENSPKQLECRLILTRSSSLDPLSSHWSHRSGVQCRLPLSVVPRQLLSSRVPLPLPATPRFQVQKPFVWFRAKTDKGIIYLAGHLYSVTRSFNVRRKQVSAGTAIFMHIDHVWPACFADYKRRA